MVRCSRCVMDNNSDNTITFNENGECNYCSKALKEKANCYFPNELGKKKLKSLIKEVKKAGKGKKYDCIMGLSGGLDSSYLAYLGYRLKLRVLAVHIDDGYDTEISKKNLKRIIKATGFDYKVIKPDSEQFNQLTLAYMRAGVPNIAVPQDNVLFAFLYGQMKKYKIKYFFSGKNFALESILQNGNMYKNTDVVNIKAINAKYGTYKINKLKFLSTLQKEIDKKIFGFKTVEPLDYIDYRRDKAFKDLHEFCGFEYYGRKHLENILTAFVQLYWFPRKFNVDKRTSHLSSMIISDQLTRDEAIKELSEPLYDEDMMNSYISIICSNMNLSAEEFGRIMDSPTHQHNDFKVEDDMFIFKFFKIRNFLKDKLFN